MATKENHIDSVPTRKLWFGLSAAAIAWLVLGFIDLMIVWQVCGYANEYGVDKPATHIRIAVFLISLVLLVVATTGGLISRSNLRALSPGIDLLKTPTTEIREFMAVVGVIVSIMLGVGIVWLALPPLIVQLCERAK